MGNDDVADPTRGNEYREWIIEAKPREGKGSREWNIRINVTADEASLQHRYIKT